MDNKRKMPVSNIGTASLLMIFIVLCMVIFALLSLTEANRDYKYSEAMAKHNTQYYEACNIAYEQIAAIDAIDAIDAVDTVGAVGTSDGRNFDVIEGVEVVKAPNAKNTNSFVFRVAMNDKQAIEVVLDLNAKGTAMIKSFAEIQTTEWKGDKSLNLFNGELE